MGRLAHIRQFGQGAPGWSHGRWGLVGATPSISGYDIPYGAGGSNVGDTIAGGFHSMVEKLPLDEPTMNRSARVSAQINTMPAARYFGSYVSSGTGQGWSGAAVAHVPRQGNMNFNLNMQGAAELHPATVYDPFPSPSALYPKVV